MYTDSLSGRTSFFTFTTICAKFILSEDQQTLIGVTTLFGSKATRRIHGEKEELSTFNTEEERIEGLNTHFGIILSPAQQAGIRGLPSAIA